MLINSPNISGSLKVTGNTVVTGSLTVLGTITGAVAGTTATASYVEYSNIGNKPTLISGSSQVTYSGLTGIPSGIVSGSIFSGSFIGDGSQLSGVTAGFPFTGSAQITGSLGVTGSITATTFIGDGSQLTGIADPTPITATVNTTNSPFTVTSQSIVIVDSINGNVTINLPDLDTIVGTSDQRPILIYKNDYSQNVVYVQPSGSQLVNGTTQDIIVSLQIGIVYNPTSAGWVTEGNSYQSLAELELFFVPRTETGSLSVATASYVEYTDVVNKPTLVSGSSQISFSGITNKPTLVSGSSQVTYSGLTGIPSGIVSSSVQVEEYNVFPTTGSNQFNGNQSITGSLTVTGQVVAQTLNVQQVTSSIVYSSGSNVFGNSLANTQQFTGSVGVTGSLTVNGINSLFNANNGTLSADILTVRGGGGTGAFGFKVEANNGEDIFYTNNFTYDIIANPVSGKFGIGTTSPGRALEIYRAGSATAQLKIGDASTAKGYLGMFSNALYINAGGTFDSGWTTDGSNGIAGIVMETSNGGSAIAFGTAGSNTSPTERMRINSAGRLLYNASTFAGDELFMFKFNTAGSYTQAINILDTNSSANGSTFMVFRKSDDTYLGNIRRSGTSDAIYMGGNDHIALGSGNTERMRITSDGNVGIGTTNPLGLLHITPPTVSGTRVDGLRLSKPLTNAANYLAFQQGGNGWRMGINYNDGTYPLVFLYGASTPTAESPGSEFMRINASGQVGIGIAPTAILHIADSSGATRLVVDNTANAAAGAGIYMRTYSGGSVVSNATVRTDNAGNFTIFTGTSSDGERMRITSAGNVGIGLTNPQYRLHVTNSNTLEGTIAIGDDEFPGLIYSSAQSGEFRIDNRSSAAAGYISFYPNGQQNTLGNERLRITAAGTVQPGANGTQDLGTSSLRWATVYTSDLSLSNGIGDYTIVEGEHDLFLYNNKNNKVYKFVVEEVDPSTATPKKS